MDAAKYMCSAKFENSLTNLCKNQIKFENSLTNSCKNQLQKTL